MEDTSFEKCVEAMKYCLKKEGCCECPMFDNSGGLWCVDGIRYITCVEGVSAFTLKLLQEKYNAL